MLQNRRVHLSLRRRRPHTLLLRLRKSQGTDRKTLSELKPQVRSGACVFSGVY